MLEIYYGSQKQVTMCRFQLQTFNVKYSLPNPPDYIASGLVDYIASGLSDRNLQDY